MSKSLRPLAAVCALLAIGGCGQNGGQSTANGGATAQAPGITPEALQAAAQDEPVRRFYEARQWQSAWNEQSAGQLTQALQGATRHGLNPAEFTAQIGQGQAPVEREIALTKAALSYANALAHGKTDPKRLFEVYTLPGNQVDVPAGLAEAAGRGNAAEWIESLAPQDEEYRALSQAYVQQLQAAQPQQGGQQQGGQQAGNQQQTSGNQQAGSDGGAQPKQKASQTRQAQNAAPEVPRDRAVILAVNLERRRWLAREAPATRIDVNTAASFLRYMRDNQVADQRVVVNGEPGWETPQLGSPIYRLVANPDWTVPESIERDELADLSPAALQRKHMERKNGRIVQMPGPDNALGLVKLDMQNDEAIYLHDTPSKWAFQRPQRHLSHGCVRVNDAVGFARMLAEHGGKLAEFDQAMKNPQRETTFVGLDQQIPVRLLYHSAYLDNGRLLFVSDPYGWDAKVAEALGLPVPPASRINAATADQARQKREGDVGP